MSIRRGTYDTYTRNDYSDDDGMLARLQSAERWEPACEHVGVSGVGIDVGL